MTTIALHHTDTSIEGSKLTAYCSIHDINIVRIKKDTPFLDTYTPCGSVEWCLSLLKKKVIPDYYPEWAECILHRKVWQSNEWILDRKLFVKPADSYKKFNGFVTHGTYSKKKKPPFWYSEIVKFENEWRCYVSRGQILCSKWYWGDEVNTPNLPDDYYQKLQYIIPTHYSGAVDIGSVKDIDDPVLIEAQHPVACGWYGSNFEDIDLYIKWLEAGWLYMKDIIV